MNRVENPSFAAQKSIIYNKLFQRRALHIAGSAFIGYYLIPEMLPYSINKQWLLVGIILLISGIELFRKKSAHPTKLDPLLRDHELKRPPSYVYFALGSIILIFTVPQYISIPCILSTAFCDPIIGEMKRRKNRFIGYIIGFFLSLIIFGVIWHSASLILAFTIPVIGASSLIFAEYISTPLLDDDLLMQIVPAILLFIFILLLSSIFPVSLPSGIIHPLF
jgi:hypothetical protein